jgi:cytochrome c-type biogenesis protein
VELLAFMELMSTHSIPLIAAFFIGIMMSLSPCPMATNIAAIAAISRKIGKTKHTLLVGIAYTLGRMFTYAAIASLIVWAGLNTQSTSFFLQKYGEPILGPALILIGVLMFGVIKLPAITGGRRVERIKERLSNTGFIGAFLLGVMFALAFCPFSAVLFFGMLIPLAITANDGVLIPSVFALGTGLPVIIFSLILSNCASMLAEVMGKVSAFESLMRKLVATAFILAGAYYLMIIYFV